MQLSVCRQHQTFLYIFFSTSVIPCYCRIFDWIRFTRPNGRMGMDRVSYTGNIYMCGPSQHWRVDMQKDRIYVLPRGLKNFLSYWAIMLLFLVLSGWQMHRCLAYVQIGILLFCSVKNSWSTWILTSTSWSGLKALRNRELLSSVLMVENCYGAIVYHWGYTFRNIKWGIISLNWWITFHF